MKCPYIYDGKCNRGCRGFQCRYRDEKRNVTAPSLFGLGPLVWLWCWAYYSRASQQVRCDHKDVVFVNSQRMKYDDLLKGASWRR